MSLSTNQSRKEAVLSRRQIEGLIADGRSIIIVDQKVLKIDAWLPFHPGGQKAIQHMVGRDATDEVTALHSAEAKQQMNRYQIGKIEGRWLNFVPPIQGGTYRAYVEDSEGTVREDLVNDSQDDSRAPSPLFDVEEVRIRNRRSAHASSSTASSVSSGPDPEDLDGPAFLDSQTKQELDLDISKYPSLDTDTQDIIIQKYRLLDERIRAEGLYECNYTDYMWDIGRVLALFGTMLLFLRWGWYGTSGAFLGVFWHQLVFMAHDSGHMGITHNFTIDTLIGMTVAAPLGGLSLGWWKRTHNVHHIVTNSPEHDPDNQHLPVFAVNHRFLGSLFSTYHERVMAFDAVAKFLVPLQAYLYYPIMTLGRFNLYVQSYTFLLQGQGPRKGIAWWHRWFEIAGIAVFWAWFGYGIVYKSIPTAWGRFAYIMISHMMTTPLHVQITVSHFAMSTSDLGPNESFPMKMLRTTMDVDCPPWLDFFHGGLQFQAIHHLYPRMPKHNLRRAQKMVQQFCNEVGIPYALYGFVDGNKTVIGKLAEVSRQAAILAKCQKAIAERGDLLHGH